MRYLRPQMAVRTYDLVGISLVYRANRPADELSSLPVNDCTLR